MISRQSRKCQMLQIGSCGERLEQWLDDVTSRSEESPPWTRRRSPSGSREIDSRLGREVGRPPPLNHLTTTSMSSLAFLGSRRPWRRTRDEYLCSRARKLRWVGYRTP